MAKTVNIKIAKDKTGEYGISYEVDGYSGLSCEEVSNVLSALGNTTSHKLTDAAYQQELPIPQPIHNS
jgi:hypothetical protein